MMLCCPSDAFEFRLKTRRKKILPIPESARRTAHRLFKRNEQFISNQFWKSETDNKQVTETFLTLQIPWEGFLLIHWQDSICGNLDMNQCFWPWTWRERLISKWTLEEKNWSADFTAAKQAIMHIATTNLKLVVKSLPDYSPIPALSWRLCWPQYFFLVAVVTKF